MTLGETLRTCCMSYTPVSIKIKDFVYHGTAGGCLRRYKNTPVMDIEVRTYGPETSDDYMFIYDMNQRNPISTREEK